MNGRRSSSASFTLVELVLAVGITAVLAALLLSIVTNTLGIWERGAATMATETAGAVALDRLSLDVSAWTCSGDGRGWSQSRGDADATQELRFVSATSTTSRDARDVSAERLVVYVWHRAEGLLYRWESTAQASLDSGYDLDLVAAEPGPEWILAEGVHGFAVRWYDGSGGEIRGAASVLEPVRVEVSLTLISEVGRARLAAVADGKSSEPVAQILAENTRTLTRWVNLETGGGR